MNCNNNNNNNNSDTLVATVFSYEIIANLYFEMCSLYSHLFTCNQDSFLNSSDEQMKTLITMINGLAFCENNATKLNNSSDDQLPIVRLKFLNNIIENDRLYMILNKNIKNFDQKLVNFIIFAFIMINTSNTSVKQTETLDKTKETNIENEMTKFLTNCLQKIQLFQNLGIKFNYNCERVLIDFINKYSFKIKNIEVNFNEKDLKIFKILVLLKKSR
jgi:hypothetical protein